MQQCSFKFVPNKEYCGPYTGVSRKFGTKVQMCTVTFVLNKH